MPILDDHVPQSVDQLVNVLKIIDISVPERVIDVPTIVLQDRIPQRTVRRCAQMAEQLVEVPTVPFFVEQTVDIPVPRTVLFIASDGHEWCRIVGPTGVYFWRVGTPYTQWEPPEGYTASPGRYINTGNAEVWLVVDVPVTMHYKFQQSSPVYVGRYLRFRSSTECWLLQFLHRDRAHSANCTVTLRFHSAVLGLVVDMPVGVQTTGLWSDSGENWFRSCSSSLVDILIPMVQTIQQIIEIHRCCSYLVVDVPGVRVSQILRCKRGGDSRLPQLQLLRIPSRFRACSWTRSLTCLCCATTGAWSLGAENCGFSAVAVHRQGVDVPAIMQRRVSQWEVPQVQFIA